MPARVPVALFSTLRLSVSTRRRQEPRARGSPLLWLHVYQQTTRAHEPRSEAAGLCEATRLCKAAIFCEATKLCEATGVCEAAML